jgi:hypothetical protein
MAMVVELQQNRKMLGDFGQTVDVLPNVFGGTVVVVQDGEDAVDEVVVGDAEAVVDGEGEMDEVVQEEMGRSPDQLA